MPKSAQEIRKLPGRSGALMKKESFPPQHVLYNPSVLEDGSYICLRDTEATPTHEMNHMVLYHSATSELWKVHIPDGMLLPTYNAYRGIEDARIVKFEDRIWFTATSTHATMDMRNVVLLGYLDKDAKSIEYMTVLTNFPPPTKNICPFVYKGTLCLLDTYGKKLFKIEKIEGEGEYIATVWKELRGLKSDPCEYRGSTSPIFLHGNTWGCVVHDVIFNGSSTRPGSKLLYTHLWMEFDIERGAITFLSSPFWCMHLGIEFASGIRYDPKTMEVHMFMGVKDEHPCVCVTPLYELRAGKM